MRIDEPTLVADGNGVRLQAKVHVDRSRGSLPDILWFRYPAEFREMLSVRVEPFAVTLSSLSATRGEPLQVCSCISERVHAGLEEYWSILAQWLPERYHPVTVRPEGWAPDESGGGDAGTAFSGGVDSFFTLMRHATIREPRATYRIRYALFVHGFDIELRDERTYAVAARAYEAALEGLGVRLVRVATNLRHFVADWPMTHGSALCGTALSLGSLIRRFYVPSSKTYTSLEPWGSTPLIDHLLSSDTLEVVHDGAAFTRFEKLEAMQDWLFIRSLLRICWVRPDGLRNCGACQKCLRTMLHLASLGILDQFETFPAIPYVGCLRRCTWDTAYQRAGGKQAIAHARAQGRSKVSLLGRYVLAKSLLNRWLIRIGLRHKR